MKRITLITVLLIAFSLSALSQGKTKIDNRFACPNEKRDTLFVTTNMVELMTSVWSQPINRTDRPVIISVNVLDPYVLKMGLQMKISNKN